jgi:hypothetical protein
MRQRRRPRDGPSKLFGVHPIVLGPKEAGIVKTSIWHYGVLQPKPLRESDAAKDFAVISHGAVGFGACIRVKRNGFSKSLQ